MIKDYLWEHDHLFGYAAQAGQKLSSDQTDLGTKFTCVHFK